MLSLEICCWSPVTSSITTSWSEKIWDECLLLVLANERWSTSRARFESGRHDRSCVTFLCEPVKQNVHLPWFFSRELFLWNSRCVWSCTCFQPKTAVCSSKHRRTNFHFSQCLVHRWCLAMDDHKIASLSQKEILSQMGTHRITTYCKSNQCIHFSAVSPAQDLRLLCAERIWFSKTLLKLIKRCSLGALNLFSLPTSHSRGQNPLSINPWPWGIIKKLHKYNLSRTLSSFMQLYCL